MSRLDISLTFWIKEIQIKGAAIANVRIFCDEYKHSIK
jgi:hypothetical protein